MAAASARARSLAPSCSGSSLKLRTRKPASRTKFPCSGFIFHTNGDTDTNNWASQKIGEVKKKHWTTGGLIKGFTNEDHSIFFRQRPGETQSTGDLGITEDREPGMRPEEFSKLKRGGDGKCEAVILWLGHEFAVNDKMNFCKRPFQQEKRPSDK